MEERQSLRSLKEMAKAKGKTLTDCQSITSGIDDLGDDLMQNILSRLPALSFASAACVSLSWNSLCNRILSSPKLASAVSLSPSLEDAVNEVVDKVLSEPIRPHFVLASIGPSFSLQEALQLIDRSKLGSRVPMVMNVCEGVIGRDVHTDQFVEVQWEVTEWNRGIILTVGFLPGLKARIVPLLFQHKGPRSLLVAEFVMVIRESVSAVSDSASPAGIILFAERKTDIKPVLQTIEYSFPEETFIVGGCGKFLYRSDSRNNITRSPDSSCAAVALTFARDRNRPLGIGETQFHVMLSTGISPVGEMYRAVSVECSKSLTRLAASSETLHEHLDGEAILDELGDPPYIGVTKRRSSVGMEKERWLQFHEFHEVLGGDEEYLFVYSVGIETGEPFRFYMPDSQAALSSCNKVSDNLRHLKLNCDCRNNNNHVRDGGCFCNKRKVFGGIIFSCSGRGDSFFEHPGVDSSPFLNNFPGATFGGTYCAGEIGRRNLKLYDQDNEEVGLVRCSQHVYSAVYLVMSYRPPPTPQR